MNWIRHGKRQEKGNTTSAIAWADSQVVCLIGWNWKIPVFLFWLILLYLTERRAFCVCCLLGALLGKKDSMNVGQDTSRGNSDSSKKLVQLFVILDSKSDVTGHNTALLVVTGSIASKFQDFSAQVLQDSSKVDRCSCSHTGSVLSLTQITSNTTNWELQTSLGTSSSALLLSTSSFSFSC